MAKRIGAIVSLSIIGILILATIIMANVNVDYSIHCATPDVIYVDNGEGSVIYENKNDIVEIISNASKEKSLTALFNGRLRKKANLVSESNVGKTIPSIDGFYVRYCYQNPQKLMDGKKEYKDANGATVFYKELVFTVNNLEGAQLYKVYVVQDETKPNIYTHYYELEADFAGLYELISQQ